jgi:hypothetical protein
MATGHARRAEALGEAGLVLPSFRLSDLLAIRAECLAEVDLAKY